MIRTTYPPTTQKKYILKMSTLKYSHFEQTVYPIVFCTLLGGDKYYVCITRNMNETLAKWKSKPPSWVKQHGLKKIIEVEPYGNEHALHQMAVSYIVKHGHANVRSSIPGHSIVTLKECPAFFDEFMERFTGT